MHNIDMSDYIFKVAKNGFSLMISRNLVWQGCPKAHFLRNFLLHERNLQQAENVSS